MASHFFNNENLRKINKMKKENFSKISNVVFGLEALERGLLSPAIDFFENAGVTERSIALIKSGTDLSKMVSVLKNELESSLPLIEMARISSFEENTPDAITFREKMFKYFGTGKGSYAVSLKSPMIKPHFNQRSLTETTGSSLIGTDTRSDLTELPNVIPALQKLGVTFNYVDGVASQQAIPTVITNAPVADVLNNVIVGTLPDPAFDLCPGKVKTLTTQLPLSRRFFTQASPASNELLKMMMFNTILDALMYRTFYGTEASGQCKGLYENASVEKVASPSFDELKGYALMDKVYSNEAPAENCVWVLNSALEKVLKARPLSTGSDRRIIERGLFLEKPYILSERIAAGQLSFGAFQSVVLTLFNLEMLFDQYSSETNAVTIKQWQSYSMDVRHPGWIVFGTGLD